MAMLAVVMEEDHNLPSKPQGNFNELRDLLGGERIATPGKLKKSDYRVENYISKELGFIFQNISQLSPVYDRV